MLRPQRALAKESAMAAAADKFRIRSNRGFRVSFKRRWRRQRLRWRRQRHKFAPAADAAAVAEISLSLSPWSERGNCGGATTAVPPPTLPSSSHHTPTKRRNDEAKTVTLVSSARARPLAVLCSINIPSYLEITSARCSTSISAEGRKQRRTKEGRSSGRKSERAGELTTCPSFPLSV